MGTHANFLPPISNDSRSRSFDEISAACRPLIDMGAALHWLRPKSKAPLENSWSTAPVYSFEQLRESYREGNNVGIRLGEPSLTPYGYLHVIDLDIRSDEHEAEAWQRLNELIPEARSLPSVVSGSGGASRHLYFVHHKPLKSEKLFKSSTFKMVFDANLGREVKRADYEVELFGTGKQVVLPPSIHPNTGLPYVWERPFDYLLMDLGVIPYVSTDFSDYSSELDDDDDGFGAAVRSAPLADLSDADVDRIMANLPADWVDDYDQWRTAGMALDHQYEGSQAGFDRWVAWSKKSDKFDMKVMKKKWKSFKEKSHPVTMRSLILASKEVMLQANLPALFVEEDPTNVEEDPLYSLLGPPATKPATPKPENEWEKHLQTTKSGAIKATLPNCRLILENDPRCFGCLAYNGFKDQEVFIDAPKQVKGASRLTQFLSFIWKVDDPVGGTGLHEAHVHELRNMLEAHRDQGGYGVRMTVQDLKAAITMVANSRYYHPVKQYLESCESTWDGVPRAEKMFINYLGCEDNPYHREASRLMLLGAVTRIFEPGAKYDFFIVLEGPQGIRKSTMISVLGRSWSTELAADLTNNERMVEAITGTWIVEIPELQGFNKADTDALKAWISRTTDRSRGAYKMYVKDYPRQCIFIGTTNDRQYLRDPTGGRRFWPIECGLPGEIDTEKLEGEVDQIWGEVTHLYKEMRTKVKTKYLNLSLTSGEAKRIAKEMQASRKVETLEDVLAGRIGQWLDTPIGTEGDDMDPSSPPVYRNEVCGVEIYEALMKDDRSSARTDQTRIGIVMSRMPGWSRRGRMPRGIHGRQIVYVRHKPIVKGEDL